MIGPFGYLFQTIKHQSNKYILDVGRIISVDCRQRLFCIFDRNLPYQLDITYYKPSVSTSLGINPIIGGNGGIMLANETVHKQNENLNYRYKTEREVELICNEINEKKKLLEAKKISDDLETEKYSEENLVKLKLKHLK